MFNKPHQAPDFIQYENIRLASASQYVVKQHQFSQKQTLQVEGHFHSLIEVMWFYGGDATLTVEGLERPVKNQLLTVSSLSAHALHIGEGGIDFFLLQCEPSLFERLSPAGLSLLQGTHLVQPSLVWQQRLTGLFTWLYQTVDQALPEQHSVLNALIAAVTRSQSECGIASVSQQQQPHVYGVIAPLIPHLAEQTVLKLSLQQAASLCSVTESHFSRSFSAYFGMGFKAYQLRRRVGEAIRLLQNPFLSIAEIAYSCHFSDSAHFCGVFKKMVGTTPSQYRKHQVLSSTHP